MMMFLLCQPRPKPRWTLILELDPDWPDNTSKLFHVKGLIALQNISLPGLPEPSQ